MEGKGNRNPKQILIFLILISAILALYFYLSNNRSTNTVEKPNSEAEKILAKDLTAEYPATPTAVVKLYSRISKCLYNNKWNNDKVNNLIIMMRELYSKEMLENNPEEKYLTNFKSDIADFHKKNKKIMTYRVDGNSRVTTWKEEENEFASLNVVYSMSEKKDHYKIYENFILQKENNQWKIVGWKIIPEVNIVE